MEIFNLVTKTLKEANPRKFKNKIIRETAIFGSDGELDSLGLVSFLVIVEQNIEDQYNVEITIADEKAMSLKHSPFRTVGTLVDYLEGIIEKIKKN